MVSLAVVVALGSITSPARAQPMFQHLGDLPGGVLEIHREAGEEGYEQVERLGPTDLAAVPVPGLPDTTVDLAGLL
jgi:hypothetical protein